MPESIQVANNVARGQRLRSLLAPAAILLVAGGIIAVTAGDWNTWTSNRTEQETDDAYVRADLTPLSTKVAGLVSHVAVSDYQTVKAGDLLVQLRDDDFRAQVQQAEAAVTSGESSLINNQRQKELQDARIVQAQDGIQSAEADVDAAEAGIAAAKSALTSAQSGIEGTKADVQRTLLERKRQEALVATESATRQKLEQATADEERDRATLSPIGEPGYCGGPTGQPTSRPGARPCPFGQLSIGSRSAAETARRAGLPGAAPARRPGSEEGIAHAGANKSGLYPDRCP